jgi:hypothetical protein
MGDSDVDMHGEIEISYGGVRVAMHISIVST